MMPEKKWVYGILAALGALGALAAFWLVLLGSIYGVAQDRGFYAWEYERLGTYEYVGMSEEDLGRATEALLEYMREADADKALGILNVNAVVHGVSRQVFNEKEMTHMADVRDLYQRGSVLCRIFAGVLAGVVCFLIFYLWRRGRDGGYKRGLRWVLRGFWIGSGLGLGVLGVLVCYAALDFSGFWTALHEMVFTNDLWLLDPREDILIQMMQGDLFFDMVVRIIVWAGGVWGLVSGGVIAGQYGLRKSGRSSIGL